MKTKCEPYSNSIIQKTYFSKYFSIINTIFLYITLIFFTSIHHIAYSNTNISNIQNIKNLNTTVNIAFNSQNIDINFYKGFSNTESQIHSALFNGLVILDSSTLSIKKGLAISWFISKDETVYTFYIRENAKFSDGTTITASDVKASWLHILHSNSVFSYLMEPISGVLAYQAGNASIEDIGINAISDRALQVTLERPNNEFLKIISHTVFSVIKDSFITIKNWEAHLDTIPFSGAYRVINIDKKYMIFEKNTQHWAEKFVNSKHIVIHFYSDKEQEILAQDIQLGNIDWSATYVENTNIDSSWIFVNQIFGTNYLFFKTSKKPWNNEKIRTAIRLLIPFDTIRTSMYQFPAKSLIPPLYNNYTAPNISYSENSKKSMELLEKAGFPNGDGLPPLVIIAPSSQGEYQKIYDTIKVSIEKNSNIKVKIKNFPTAKYYDLLTTEDYVIGSYSWIGDYISPAAFFQMWVRPNKTLGYDYNSQIYRDTYFAALSETKGEIAKNFALQKIEKILLESTIVIPLHHLYAVNIVRKDILEGWEKNILDHHHFARLYKKPLPIIPFVTSLPTSLQ